MNINCSLSCKHQQEGKCAFSTSALQKSYHGVKLTLDCGCPFYKPCTKTRVGDLLNE